MIGQWVRSRHEGLTKKYMYRIFDKPVYREFLSLNQLDKIIKVYVGVMEFVFSIAFFLAILTVFMRYVLPRLEFEKTVVLILVIIMFILRSLSEKLSRSE